MPEPFLDTNVILRHLLQDHTDLSPRAHAIMERVERGELTVRLSDIVVFETVFVLQRVYRIPRDEIAGAVLRLLELPTIILPEKQQYRDVFAQYQSSGGDFADCFHAVLMERLGLNEIISFDHDFDRLPGITRREE